MIADYQLNNSAEIKGGLVGTYRAVSVTQACKYFKISCSPVVEDKTLLCPLPIPTKNLGWVGALIPSPKAVGLECLPPSSILLMLPLQIPCSLEVAKLMSNSCPPLPLPDSEIKKRAPVPRLLPRWGLCYWVGGE